MNAARMQLDAVLPMAGGTAPASAPLLSLAGGETFSQVLASECDPGVLAEVGSQSTDTSEVPTPRDGSGEVHTATQAARIVHPLLAPILADAVPPQPEDPLVAGEGADAKRIPMAQRRGTSLASTPRRRTSGAEGVESGPLGIDGRSGTPPGSGSRPEAQVVASGSLIESIPAPYAMESSEDAEEPQEITTAHQKDSLVPQPAFGVPLPVVQLHDPKIPNLDWNGMSQAEVTTPDCDAAGDLTAFQRSSFSGGRARPIATPSDRAPRRIDLPGSMDPEHRPIDSSLTDSEGQTTPGNPPPVAQPLRTGASRKVFPTTGERSPLTDAPADSQGTSRSGSRVDPERPEWTGPQHFEASLVSRSLEDLPELQAEVPSARLPGPGRSTRPTGGSAPAVPGIAGADTPGQVAAGYDDLLQSPLGRISIAPSVSKDASVTVDVGTPEAALSPVIQTSEERGDSSPIRRTSRPAHAKGMPHPVAEDPVSGMPGTPSVTTSGTELSAGRKWAGPVLPSDSQVRETSSIPTLHRGEIPGGAGGTPSPTRDPGDPVDSTSGPSGGRESSGRAPSRLPRAIDASPKRDRESVSGATGVPSMPEVGDQHRVRWNSTPMASEPAVKRQDPSERMVHRRLEGQRNVQVPTPPEERSSSPLVTSSRSHQGSEGEETPPAPVSAATDALQADARESVGVAAMRPPTAGDTVESLERRPSARVPGTPQRPTTPLREIRKALEVTRTADPVSYPRVESASGSSVDLEAQEIPPSRVAAALSTRTAIRSQNGRPAHRIQPSPGRVDPESASRIVAGGPSGNLVESGFGASRTPGTGSGAASSQNPFDPGRRSPAIQDPLMGGNSAFALRSEATGFHSEIESKESASPSPRVPLTSEAPRPTSHQVELETLGQGRLQLRMTETGSELRIEARQVGNALSGTEGGWQDLQSRLGESGVVLGPLQSGDPQPDFRRDQAPPDPRHAVCYDGSQSESNRQRDPSGFQTRGGGASFPDPLPESVSDLIPEGPPARRGQGREWWA